MEQSFKTNRVFIATSLDGYIADKNGNIEWLNSVPNPNNDDMGYIEFTNRIDALVMGRNTFETVCGFDIDWPYTKPVFVLSNSLNKIPNKLQDKVFLIKGTIPEIILEINNKGYNKLYIDGGSTIQSFLKEDLIDEFIISTIPVLLGEGISLFKNFNKLLNFELASSKVYLDNIVQSHYKRKRQ